MVKKVETSKTPGPVKPRPVESGSAVRPTEAPDVGAVGSIGQRAPASRVRRPTRPMTSAEREHLFRLIHEEADRMFGPNGLPESQRRTLEGAVRITVDASITDEEEEKAAEGGAPKPPRPDGSKE